MNSENSEGRPDEIKYTGKLIAKNTIYNLLGHMSPLLVAVIAIPLLIDGMGTERFGVLTMAWIAVGYFSLFDMGIGRATTKFVAEYYARGLQKQIMGLVKASMLMLLVFGIIMGAVLAGITPWLVGGMLNIPEWLRRESAVSFYLLAISMPIALLIAGSRGVLESQQRFGVINAIRIPASIATFLIPLAILPFSNSLIPIIVTLVFSRLVVMLLQFYYCYKGVIGLGGDGRMEKSYFKMLLSYGGWLTVCNIVGPLLGSMDRFFIGSLITLNAVTFYATPFDVVTKLFIIPIGIMGVVFPAFSAFSADQEDRLDSLHRRSLNYIIVSVAPVTAFIIAFAYPLVDLWLGPEFMTASAPVLQLLAAGVLFSSVARVPFNAVQAMGRASLPAIMFLLELPVYAVAVVYVTKNYGITGTAGLWLVRLVLELGAFAVLYRKVANKENRRVNYMSVYIWLMGSQAAAFGLALVPAMPVRIAAFIVFTAALGFMFYRLLFDDYDRLLVKDGVARLRRGRFTW